MGKSEAIIAVLFPPFPDFSISHEYCPVQTRFISHEPERTGTVQV